MLTDQQHPITPPPELVAEWCAEWYRLKVRINTGIPEYVATQAARWGADQELEACIDVILAHPGLARPELLVEVLRDVRRPKPPSLAEQALTVLEQTMVLLMPVTGPEKIKQFEAIRTALERLQELENNDN